MAEYVDLSRCAEDDFLMGDVARKSDAVDADIFVGDGTSSPRNFLGFGDAGGIEGFAEFAEELCGLDGGTAGSVGFLVVVEFDDFDVLEEFGGLDGGLLHQYYPDREIVDN